MNKKKFLTLFLALIMVFSLVACGNGKDKETKKETKAESTESKKESGDDLSKFKGKTLKFAGFNGGYGDGAWKEVIKKFEEKTGAKVEATIEKNIDEVIRPQ